MNHRQLRALCAAACLVLAPATLHARRLVEPTVPTDLEVGAEHRVFLVGHAIGTQNYTCLPDKSGGFAWTPAGPQATLFADDGTQIATHFLSANPEEDGTFRATWQHSRDTSVVWAKATVIFDDPPFVEPGAVPWLLLEVVGDERGPDGGHRLSEATFIQRVNTSGGVAPATGCSEADQVGHREFVPYTTDYYFYKARGH